MEKGGQKRKKKKVIKKKAVKQTKISKQLIYNILIAEFAIVLFVSAFVLIRYAVQSAGSEREFAKLKELMPSDFGNVTEINLDGTEGVTNASPVNEEGILLEYEQLYQLNSDMVGWVSIEDTRIDYPVMQLKEDGEFYIDHNFRKEKSKSGVVFVDERINIGSGDVIIMYGHNMRSGTMFADLLEYADEEFYESHPVIQFDTLYEKGMYEVVAVFYTEAYPDEDTTHFNFYHYTDLSNETIFNQYKKNVEELSLFPCKEFTQSDELITLVTCSYHSGDGRFVVVAKKLEENQ